MARAINAAAREQRRAQVSQLYVAGATAREIGAQLGISHTTVLSDVRFLMKQWRRENLHVVENAMMKDLMRIETAISGLWAKVMRGDLDTVKQLAELIKIRASIYGYEGLPRDDYDREHGYVAVPGMQLNVIQANVKSDEVESVLSMSDEQLGQFIANMTASAIPDEPVIIEGEVVSSVV